MEAVFHRDSHGVVHRSLPSSSSHLPWAEHLGQPRQAPLSAPLTFLFRQAERGSAAACRVAMLTWMQRSGSWFRRGLAVISPACQSDVLRGDFSFFFPLWDRAGLCSLLPPLYLTAVKLQLPIFPRTTDSTAQRTHHPFAARGGKKRKTSASVSCIFFTGLFLTSDFVTSALLRPLFFSAHPSRRWRATLMAVSMTMGRDTKWLTLEVCREFQRGTCSRSDAECKFAHPSRSCHVENGRVIACFDSLKVTTQQTRGAAVPCSTCYWHDAASMTLITSWVKDNVKNRHGKQMIYFYRLEM